MHSRGIFITLHVKRYDASNGYTGVALVPDTEATTLHFNVSIYSGLGTLFEGWLRLGLRAILV